MCKSQDRCGGALRATVTAKMAARLAVGFKIFHLTSSARMRVVWQQHAIDRQAAGSHGRIGNVSGVVMDARPRPSLPTAGPFHLHRIKEPTVRYHPAPKSRHSAQYIPQTRDRNTSFQCKLIPPWRTLQWFVEKFSAGIKRRGETYPTTQARSAQEKVVGGGRTCNGDGPRAWSDT